MRTCCAIRLETRIRATRLAGQRRYLNVARVASRSTEAPPGTHNVCERSRPHFGLFRFVTAAIKADQGDKERWRTRNLRFAPNAVIRAGFASFERCGSVAARSSTALRQRWVHTSRNTNQQRVNGIHRDKSIDQSAELKPHQSKSTEGQRTHYLKDRLPGLPHIHRPSRDELLAAATGFWSRVKIKFKWFSIRSVRPFNADEISAFFSWVLLGHVLWIVLGTTTFFSLAILAVNTVLAQETLARWVGNYLTRSSGVRVVFESAIVPKWHDGVITFKNVFVSRRPGQGDGNGNVRKGLPGERIVATVTAASTVVGEGENEDLNYTQYDLSLEEVNVTLSFRKWFNSKGLLGDVEIKGVRGIIDRSCVYHSHHVDPRSYKHEHNPGDFEIDTFKIEDLLVTVHQPGSFRPFSVSIYNCELPQLRRQWLFYDFLAANVVSGSFDDSLFTIHPAQAHGFVGGSLDDSLDHVAGPNPWKKQSRLRISGLNIEHLNRGVEGPFSWIHHGNVDIIADIKFPVDNDQSLSAILADFYGRLEATVSSKDQVQEGHEYSSRETSETLTQSALQDDKRFLVLDLKIHLNEIRAAVPLFTKDLSYVNNAFIRPIVAYMNTRRLFIPINCRVIKKAIEFDGSWTAFDSGLMDDLSRETYNAIASDVADDQARRRRLKKVGLWSLQLAAQAFFMGLAGTFA